MKKQKSKRPDTSPVVPQNQKISRELKINSRPLTDKQKDFLDIALDKNTKLMFISGPAGTAKAQPMDADVLTPSGYVKMANIKSGDSVIGEDGGEYNVVSIHPQGIRDVMKVSFSDGTSTECTSDHLWFTKTSSDRNMRIRMRDGKIRRSVKIPNGSGSVKTTSDIMKTLYIRKTRVNHSIPMTSPVKFSEKSHLILPYTMGILLGDGCFRRGRNVSFSSGDSDIISRVVNELIPGMSLSKSGNFDYVIVHDNKMDSNGGNRINNEIKRLSLDSLYSHEKFIPEEYLFDSVDNRISLLRGLMDSDGTVSREGTSSTFATTSEKLAKTFQFLVESLGGVCFTNKYKTHYTYLNEKLSGLDCYKITISLNEINPFHLSRKSSRYITKTKYIPIRYITDVVKVGEKECQCILVNNPSHLYLTNNFIVTHNTYTSILASLQLLNTKKISDVIYLRSAVESSDSKLGYLPGEIDDKMAPYLQPLVEKLDEFLSTSDIADLQKSKKISSIPIGFLRGLNWNAKAIIADECQNMSRKELVTLITRIGEFSKVFIIGDPDQIDIGNRSGFVDLVKAFDDDESRKNGIFSFQFNEDDIVRSKLVKFITKKLKDIPRT